MVAGLACDSMCKAHGALGSHTVAQKATIQMLGVALSEEQAGLACRRF